MAGRDTDFATFVEQHGGQLRGLAYLLAADPHEAADLYQETLTKLYVSWSKVRDDTARMAYARTTMSRQLISWRRRASWRREVASDVMPETSSSVRDDDNSDVVLEALRQLAPRQRAVVVLRYYCDWSERRTADALGCSLGTVKTQASRGLAKLREDSSLIALGVQDHA